VATSKRKVTKSKGKVVSNSSRKGRSIKKRKVSVRPTKKSTKRRVSAAMKRQGKPDKAPIIQDSGAVKKARSSVEAIVEDAQKTVEDTLEPSSQSQTD
jgi:hypothetical protein